jgi:hypothetical protein
VAGQFFAGTPTEPFLCVGWLPGCRAAAPPFGMCDHTGTPVCAAMRGQNGGRSASAAAASCSHDDDDEDDEEMIALQAALASVSAAAAAEAEEQTRGRAPVRRVATGGPKEQWAAARRAPDDTLAPMMAALGGIGIWAT